MRKRSGIDKQRARFRKNAISSYTAYIRCIRTTLTRIASESLKRIYSLADSAIII